jgi:hypothetical protein
VVVEVAVVVFGGVAFAVVVVVDFVVLRLLVKYKNILLDSSGRSIWFRYAKTVQVQAQRQPVNGGERPTRAGAVAMPVVTS